MPIPNLLNPVTVILQKSDKEDSQMDHRRREVRNRVSRKQTIMVDAQVVWGKGQGNEPEATPVGTDDGVRGYLIFRSIDLAPLNYTPKRGDLVTKLAKQTVQFYIHDVTYHSHYASEEDFTLIRAEFIDRVSQS